jgi:hypothetical protein
MSVIHSTANLPTAAQLNGQAIFWVLLLRLGILPEHSIKVV